MNAATATPYAIASAPLPERTDDVYIDHKMADTLRLDGLRRRSCVHKTFIAINIVVVITAIHLAVGQLWGLCIQNNYLMESAMRLYTVGFSVIIAMNELELTPITKESLVLRQFLPRGVIYSFVGCVGNITNDIGSDNYRHWYGRSQFSNLSQEAFAEVYIMVISFMMIVLGLLYIVMGILCLDRVLTFHRVDYHKRMEQWKREGGTDEGRGCIDVSSAILA
mmetsp:Transcript_29621/g.60483  ORF Transcript_29621/g.60483 Transcript_29621/m.60483 type:complete len:222 (-) Transcript_29621:29-694(-)